MNHRATSRFWAAYDNLSPELRAQADKQFKLLKSDPRHPSLHFKKSGRLWSGRVNRSSVPWPWRMAQTVFGFGSATTANTNA